MQKKGGNVEEAADFVSICFCERFAWNGGRAPGCMRHICAVVGRGCEDNPGTGFAARLASCAAQSWQQDAASTCLLSLKC